jgi:hypothetical protein
MYHLYQVVDEHFRATSPHGGLLSKRQGYYPVKHDAIEMQNMV